MKKAATLGALISFGIAIISFAIIGIKLLDGNCEFTAEAYIGAAGFFIMIICGLIRAFSNKCPHCGKTIMDNGEYCSHCGKKIKE